MNLLRFSLLLLLISVIAGCSEPEAPVTGNLSGFALLYDSVSQVPTSEGIVVTALGAPYTATTDARGHWQMDELPAATYDLTLHKEGYGTYRYFGIGVTGNGTTYMPEISIAKLPEGKVVLDSAVFVPSYNAIAIFGATLDTEFSVLIFVDTTNDIKPEDAHAYSIPFFVNYQIAIDALISLSPLARNGLKSGRKVFVSACKVNRAGLNVATFSGSYYDPIYNQTRYAACGPKSNVIEMVLP